MEKYHKKQLIEVVAEYWNGDRLVQNEGNPTDQWIIPKEVFESTYEKVEE
jgi:hypothetical protein